jgi:hypothetical protein
VTVLAAIEFSQLIEVVWVSLVSCIVVTTAFALVVREGARSAEARRAGQAGAAALHAMLAALLLAAFAAIVIVGLTIILKK